MRQMSACAIATTVALVLSWTSTPAAQPQRNPGVSSVCGTFTPALLFLLVPAVAPLVRLNDEAWAYVDREQKIRSATGVARNVHVAAIDSFSNHDSHDLDFDLLLDPGQTDLLSIQPEDALGIEWETGIRPSETRGDGASPTLPKWAWPSDGDRVWAEGNWIFDCGHPDEDTGLYKSEIHPPRAIASMRDQAGPLPGTGLTPVPITMTDLYISGRGGFTPNQLNCGPHITLGFNGSTCGQDPPPADDSYRTTPINETDFTFAVCLPPRPAGAAFSHSVAVGPRNTVNIEPEIDGPVPATGACQSSPDFDNTMMMRVTVKLRGTATPPQSVYARHIAAGWVMPPAEPLPHRRLSVRSTNLFEDHDLDPGDGELSFWWVNVNRAASPWLRLADHTGGRDMNDYDDETGFGDGEMAYTNANFEFYLRKDQPYTLRSRGYEQDCYDTIGAFGTHYFNLLTYVACNLDLPNHGPSDDIAAAEAHFDSDSASPSHTVHAGSDYDMRVAVEHLPLGLEDTSYLSAAITCSAAGEVALVGQPFVCSTRTDNAGPGLPRSVVLTTSFDAGPPTATASAASWSVSGARRTGPHACDVSGTSATCRDVVVQVAAATPAVATVTATPLSAGVVTARANVTTISEDPDLSNNSASATIDVFQSVTIDVAPRDHLNVLNLKRGGSVSVAILTTDAFDASAVDASTVCFGDADAPTERTCVEVHGRGHLEDVNRDRRLDLVLHYDLSSTGIDLGDTKACLIARTTANTGVYACEVISPK